MIRIYPEQLGAQLREGLRACYLLSGNEPLLLQEAQDAIRAAAQQQGYTEHVSVALEIGTDWQEIFSACQALSLFASRQTLLLTLPENGPNAAMSEQLLTVSTLLHSDILLIPVSYTHLDVYKRQAYGRAFAAPAGGNPQSGYRLDFPGR